MNDYQNDTSPSGGDSRQENNPGGPYPPQGNWRPAGGPSYGRVKYQSEYEPEKPYSYQYSDYTDGPDSGGKPPRKNRKGLAVFLSIVGGVAVLALVFLAGYGVLTLSGGEITAPDKSALESPSSPQLDINSLPGGPAAQTADDGGMSNEEIAALVSPSVVGITNIQSNSVQGITMAQGTGIVMSAEGYIITNEHVVSGATGLQVTLDNGESYNAALIGGDSATDLAVIKIDAVPMPKLTVAQFGDSDQLKLGERVVAIGNAGGSEFAGTVTGGMISGMNRQIQTDAGSILTVIQTDAAINPGNSGGPLINKHGQVIGINSAKYTRENFEGIGFSIPINSAKPIIDDLIKNGRVTGRAKLGITGMDTSRVNLQAYGVPANISGVLVVSVSSGSNISQHGVVAMDILTSIDGKPIESMTSLRAEILAKKPGDRVEFGVYRFLNQPSAKQFTVTVTLDEDDGVTSEEEAQQQQQQQQQQEQQGGNPWNGIFPPWPFY